MISASSARDGLMLMGLKAVVANAAKRRVESAKRRNKEGFSGQQEGIVSVMFEKFQRAARPKAHLRSCHKSLLTGELRLVLLGKNGVAIGAREGTEDVQGRD
jgi:hypothetical protein